MIVKVAKKFLVLIAVFSFYVVTVHAMEHDTKDNSGTGQNSSPLLKAVKAKDEVRVRELLLGGANVDEVDADQRTSLHILLEQSDTPSTIAVVRVLLEHKAAVDRVDCNNMMPLDYVQLRSFAMHTLFFNWIREQQSESPL